MKLPVVTTESGGTSTATAPDMCMTYAGVAAAPMPYPNLARHGDGAGSGKVTVDGKEVMRVGDEVARSTGDEAGNCPGGVVSGRFAGKAEIASTLQTDLKAEGKRVAVQGSITAQNAGGPANTVGIAATVTQQMSYAVKKGQIRIQKPPILAAESILHCSEQLLDQLQQFADKGWKVVWGKDGEGTGLSRSMTVNAPPPNQTIILDPSDINTPARILYALSHELGHAFDGYAPILHTPGMTKERFVEENLMKRLLSEGQALYNEAKTLEEIEKSDDPKCKEAAKQIRQLMEQSTIDTYKSDKLDEDQKIARLAANQSQQIPSGEKGSRQKRTYEKVYTKELEQIFTKYISH